MIHTAVLYGIRIMNYSIGNGSGQLFSVTSLCLCHAQQH